MLPRFHASDYATVGFYLGVLLYVLGILMVIPAVIAILFNEMACLVNFLLGIAFCFVVGSLLQLCKRGRLDRRRSYLIAASAWIVVAIAAAVPLYASGIYSSFLNAVFDTVSSLTTTGVTLLQDIDHMAYSQITWRALLALFGAQGVVVIGLYLGFFGEGSFSARANAQARHESLSISLKNTSRQILMLIVFFVVGGTIVATFIGLSLGFDVSNSIMNGFWLSANAYSTGSFVPHQSSLIYYHSFGLNSFLSLLMILGTINFVTYLLVLRGRIKEAFHGTETISFVVWAGILIVLVSAILCREELYSGILSLLNHGTFMTISCLTTCGMQTVYPEQFGITLVDSALVILMVVTLIGASSCSASGGIKIFRIGQVVYWIAYTVKSALLPNNAYAMLSSGRSLSARRIYPKDAMIAMVITVLYIAAAAVGAVCFIVHGYPALNSIFESVSYVSNAGITTGITAANMSLDLKLIAIFQMWAGRLEFIALFALLAGVVMSATPRKENIPSGVKATRKAQRKAHYKKISNQLRHNIFGSDNNDSDNNKKTLALILAFILGTSLSVPFAGQATAAVFDAGDVAQTFSDNRVSSYRATQVEDLLGASERMDEKSVTFSAEAIGSPINADADHVWINVLDAGSMIGVYMSKKDAAFITNYGAYQTKGDTLRIQGVFHLMCNSHAGELEVHAKSVSVVSQGQTWVNPCSKGQLLGFMIMTVSGILLLVLRRLIYGRRIQLHVPF